MISANAGPVVNISVAVVRTDRGVIAGPNFRNHLCSWVRYCVAAQDFVVIIPRSLQNPKFVVGYDPEVV